MAVSHYNRKAAWTKYHHLYRASLHDPTRCVYCGDVSEVRDHVPALSHVLRVGSDAFRRHKISFLLYPACWHCNALLQDCEFLTIAKRSKFLIKKLEKRLFRLKSKPWSEKELNELGPNLRRYISSHETIRQWIERRLEILELTGYGFLSEMMDSQVKC